MIFCLIAFAVNEWGRTRVAITRFIFTGGNMSEGTGAVSDNETQIRLKLKRRGDLIRNVIHDFQKGSIRFGFIGNERAAKLNKDKRSSPVGKFLHPLYFTACLINN